MKYIKELDVLRAIAILLVIIGHWCPPESIWAKIIDGDMGVNIFFVLSGFLITWILLQARSTADAQSVGKSSIWINFYIRRALRIFPIYYLCLLFFYYAPFDLVENRSEIFPWLFTYTSNIYFFIKQIWDGHVSHLWSLAVEEQFYLIWPALVLFINKKWLIHLIVCFILIGALFQFYFRGIPWINYFTVSCFSAFGIGGLLSYIYVYKTELLPDFFKWLRIPVLISFAAIIFSVFQHYWTVMPMLRIFHSTVAVYLITYILVKKSSPKFSGNFFWNNSILIFIGKISYGLYLFHVFLPFVLSEVIFRVAGIHIEEIIPGFLYFLINMAVAIIFAWLSWRFVERPILKLKKNFEYTPAQRQQNLTIK